MLRERQKAWNVEAQKKMMRRKAEKKVRSAATRMASSPKRSHALPDCADRARYELCQVRSGTANHTQRSTAVTSTSDQKKRFTAGTGPAARERSHTAAASANRPP